MGKAGQYVGSIDKNSPAEAGGLLSGDRIIEVNGVNISNEYHVQVVERIKSIPDEVRLVKKNAKLLTRYYLNAFLFKLEPFLWDL